MPPPPTWGAEAREAFAEARNPERLAGAVVKFHRRLDEVLAASIRGHAVKIACTRGCSYCCSLRVEVQPHETFALAEWLRKHFSAQRLSTVGARLRENASKTRAMGVDARKHSNLRCALLGDDGACTAYEARPAQCRRFHSTRLEVCKASYANPADETIEAPLHPAVAHNADVIITQAQNAVRDAGLDSESVDMNFALLEALDNPKAWRRWRDGKKPFVNEGRG
jgi:Fe-S-cluster containining protein